jgi:hypothetical protein
MMTTIEVEIPFPTPLVYDLSEFGKMRVGGEQKHDGATATITAIQLLFENRGTNVRVRVSARHSNGIEFYKDFLCTFTVKEKYSASAVFNIQRIAQQPTTEWYRLTSALIRNII